MQYPLLRLNAKYILPVTSSPIQNGSILIDNGIIQFIGREKDFPNETACQVLNYPEHILIPGLVNSHTHLCFSHLKNKLESGIRFTDWIIKIISYSSTLTEEEEKNAIEKGVRELIATGTTAVGDISRTGFSKDILQAMGVRGTVFLEIIGFKKSMKDEQLNRVHHLLRSCKNNDLVKFGLSPHSPYSVSPQLIQSSFQLARDNKLPIAMHIAETKEELEFIKNGKGPLRKLLEEIYKWEPDWKPQKSNPLCYLNKIVSLKDITGIHLNYIDDKEMDIIKKNNMSVVYCPKSNQWFQRKDCYLLKELLKSGINVAIGTDSLASNEGLNMFEELNLIRKQYPEISSEMLLKMATINGARVLGLERETGSLEKGKKADIVGLKINSKHDSYRDIFTGESEIVFSMIDGEMIFPFSK